MCTKEAEYRCAVHFNTTDSGPRRGNIAYFGDVGNKKVVGEGDNGPGGSVGSDGSIRRGSGVGRYRGRSRGIRGEVNHGIN